MENKKTISEEIYSYDEEFRDSLTTVDEKGKRIWLYPKKPKGKYYIRRTWVSMFLLVLFFSGPWLKINHQPLLLLNFIERKFVIMGQVFWPQDFFLLALSLLTLFVFVILFTVVFGRIWCGWACPQTLFMEMVFRRIEYWIEGDAQAQRRLDSEPWNAKKLTKKISKQIIFLIISIVIAHTAMAYLIGVNQTISIVQTSPLENLGGFIGLVAFTGIFYGVFARFREQACIAVCPYGRLQGVLLTKESIVVAYDWLRGEPRGRIKKNEMSSNHGDCVDCKLCVHVCPTGIDIRNGTQLECVNCTACMDACDEVMLKVNRPPGLIRLASYASIKEGVSKIFTTRVMAYSVVLLGLIMFLSFMVFTRSSIETTVLKVPGTLFQETAGGDITNLYNVEFVNKTFENIELELKIESPRTAVLEQSGQKDLMVPAEEILKVLYIVRIPKHELTHTKSNVVLGVYQHGKRIQTIRTTFIGPFINTIK